MTYPILKEEIIINSGKRKLVGLVLVILGILFLSNNLDLFDYDWDYIWPAAIIIVGIALIYRASRHQPDDSHYNQQQSRIFGDSLYEPTGEIDGTSFKHFIGDLELNLSRAEFKSGENRIKVSIFIGDVRVFVPKDVAVKTSSDVFLGDITVIDATKSGIAPSSRYTSDNYDTAARKIFISANAFIGDIRIRQI